LTIEFYPLLLTMNPRKTTIAYVVEFSTGGSVESLHSLISGLNKSKYEPIVLFYYEPEALIRLRFESAGAAVQILFPGKSGSHAHSEPKGYNLQEKVRKLFGKRIERFYESVKYAVLFLRQKLPISLALRRHLMELDADLVHLNNGLVSDTPGILAARLCRLPIVCHVRAFSIYTHLNVFVSRYVSTFLCVSEAIRVHLVASGVDESRAIVCYDSVDLDRFSRKHVARQDLLAEFNWNMSDQIFGVIGRLDSWKGHEYFIEAIAEARRDNPAIRGLIVGGKTPAARNETYVDTLYSLVDSLKLEGNIVFAGHRTNIPEIIQCLDAVVCSSSSPEPFGLMVVESMAVGTPSIATNAGGPAEMITDNEDGLLIPLQDAPAMAQAMLRIADDKELAAKLSAAGKITVATRFTINKHVEKVCDVYDKTLLHAQA